MLSCLPTHFYATFRTDIRFATTRWGVAIPCMCTPTATKTLQQEPHLAWVRPTAGGLLRSSLRWLWLGSSSLRWVSGVVGLVYSPSEYEPGQHVVT
eukprot:3941687-Rhodomonas_salina.9